MRTEEKMTVDERQKYLRATRKRHRVADRRVKGQLLHEMEAVTGLHRKSLIRLMNGNSTRNPRRRQRGKTYEPEVDDALRVIYIRRDGCWRCGHLSAALRRASISTASVMTPTSSAADDAHHRAREAIRSGNII